ncbi:hypothetical protein [uncultured Aquimarina sp.]|uniref:hypothetical protein n=1 Tax=uncultured Aquimarina sp. TaxID=575652 RepID=UPI002630B8B7|nr:hypothetical protein [uncultured Aquimarina sp.]
MSVTEDHIVCSEGNSLKKLKEQKMTPERLRTFTGFENISDKEAQQTIDSLEQLCEAIYKHVITNST